MSFTWTQTQLERLKELDAGEKDLESRFETAEVRDRAFQELEKNLVASARKNLEASKFLRAEATRFFSSS